MYRRSARSLSPALVFVFGLAIAGGGAELEIDVPNSVARVDGLGVTLAGPDGAPIDVDLALRHDERGRLVDAGGSTVDGVPVEIKGKLRTKRGVTEYAIKAKGLTEKLSLKLSGVLAPAEGLSFKYSGPAGKASGEAGGVTLNAAGVVSSALLSLDVDAKGKISGSGTILSGFADAPESNVLVRGKLKGDRLKLAIKAGKLKLSFKGERDDDLFTGRLKYSLPPDKGTRDGFELPDFTAPPPPPPGGSGDVVLEPVVSPTRETSVALRGTTFPDAAIKIVNAAFVVDGEAGGDGAFEISVPLFQNRVNRLFVTATPLGGDPSAPVAVDVVQDLEPPRVFIDEPTDGIEVTQSEIVVAGRVSDTLSGFLGFEVYVGDQPANVVQGLGTNGSFEFAGFPLEPGRNFVEVRAFDAVGNESHAEAIVERVEPPPASSRLEVVSGNSQVGTVGRPLAAPISVRLLRPDGSPFVGKNVTFRITRSDGSLAASRFETVWNSRLDLQTDVNGVATAWWWLGTDAGCGNNRVEVSSAGIFGTARFCASAKPGRASRILVGDGNDQRVETGGAPTEPLRAWVNDACNGVAGVAVTFRVTRGGGLVDGAASSTVTTSPTGHAEARFTAGETAELQVIEATFPGNAGPPATFSILAIERGEGPTRFSGVVLDNGSSPLGGATCQLLFPGNAPIESRSSSDGSFAMEDLPHVGPAVLYVDGATATTLGGEPIPMLGGAPVSFGPFPSLSFEVVIVDGADNTLSTPVFLPRLEPANARIYDGTRDVELHCAGIEGLVMRIRAGSMRLADFSIPSPSQPVIVSVNQVHVDNIPMPMPNGAAAPFAWTLQPGGATFSPPVEIEIPNMAGLPPGAASYILSFNHDTRRFDIVATGHVVADGTVVRSDPGAGISTAGWGGLCPPYPITGDVEFDNCLQIEAEKVAGGAVPNGDYLCTNQGERIRMRAVRDESCAGDPVEWSIHPASAGSFEGASTGDEVIFAQADGFTSSSVNDVEIRARAGDIENRFKLTVFHVESDSGVLFRTSTREFLSEWTPVAADVNRIAAYMSQLAGAGAFRTREYATGAAAATQPVVNGVIESVDFFVKNGELWIRVTSGDNAGDVNITLEIADQLLHREHMTVLDIDLDIDRAISDQFPGVDANSLPSRTGSKNYPYVLMGQRDGLTRVIAKATASDVPGDLVDKVDIRLALANFNGELEPVGTSNISRNGSDWTATLRHGSFTFTSPLQPIEYKVIAGVDLDDDGLDADEIFYVFGETQGYHLKVVTDAVYEVHRAFFATGAFVASSGFDVGPALLQNFATATAPEGTTSVSRTIPVNRLDHNVGALFNSSGEAEIKRYIFPTESTASQAVRAATEFRQKLELIFGSHKSEVLDFFEQNAPEFSQEFTWELVHGTDRTVTFGTTTDLFLAIGTGSLFGEMTVLVSTDPSHEVLQVEFDGFLFDLYDWDYSGGGFLDDRAATVQAGFNTLGSGGNVFESEIRLDGVFFNYGYYFGEPPGED